MAMIEDDPTEEEERQIIEALLFTSPEPLKFEDFKEVLDLHGKTIKSHIKTLNKQYRDQGRAFEISRISGGYQMMTRGKFQEVLETFYEREEEFELSPAAMETLSIVAYEQPITRAEVENIRGVQSGQLLRSLLDEGFLRIRGREDSPGQPILYGTSPQFLELFGLEDLEDLPEPEDLADPGQENK